MIAQSNEKESGRSMSNQESLQKLTNYPLRVRLEERERQVLADRAQLSERSGGRLRPEPECSLRTCYQRDRDRIVHCKAFRRLKHKTQVFLSPTGDHYRTRLTHTLEVSQIARTIGRALGLNEDLIEGIALGHDLGHTAFGHGGERVLNDLIPEGFCHNEQSLRIVDRLEKEGRGLNLTFEVRDGILKHSKGRSSPILAECAQMPVTLEGHVVRLADVVAYLNHDLDDALRAEVLHPLNIPENLVRVLGSRHSERIHTLVEDIIVTSLETDVQEVRPSPRMLQEIEHLRDFLFNHVYELPLVRQDFDRVRKVIEDLFEALIKDQALFEQEIGLLQPDSTREQQAFDHIAGMTDRYALELYKRVFLPRPWMKV
jgi:dGTPase